MSSAVQTTHTSPYLGARPGGRSGRVRTAVLQAALKLLGERGYEATTLPEVARRAGVHPTTIYRRWHSKQGLLTDAMLVYAAENIPTPDTGSLRCDLEQLLRQVINALAEQPVRALLSAVVADATAASSTIAAERTRYWQERFSHAAVIVERAIERGDLAHNVDAYDLIEYLVAPAYMRALLTGRGLDDSFVDQQVANTIAAFTRDRLADPPSAR
jgi:AcrR family transcriptional regulator